MTATIATVASGLQTRLATITGLRAFASQPDQISPPVGYPVLNSVNYHRAYGGGLVSVEWSIYIIVGRYTDARAYVALDGFLSTSGASSVRAAIEADKTLNGTVQTLILSSATSIMPQTQGDAEFLMARFDCTVHC